MIVGLVGLLSAPALNGSVGFVLGYDEASQRFMVQVEDGSVKKFKRVNLIVETDIGDEEDGESDFCASSCHGFDKNLLGSLSTSSARL